MKEYANIIADTLEGKETGYRYPGEILERSIIETPEKVDEVLEGFLNYTSYYSQLETLKNTKNAFNSNQIDMFVKHIGNYKAEILRFRLTEEVVGVKKEFLNSVKDYFYLGKYISAIITKFGEEATIVQDFMEEFSNVIHLMKNTLYDEDLIEKISYLIKLFKLDKKCKKDDKKYLSLITKATDNVLSDSDIAKLQEYGYSLLSCRKLNALNLNSYVAGRKDKVWFYYLKEAFFETTVLSEKEKEIISEKIRKSGNLKKWTLERAICGQKTMQGALALCKFKETSVNASFCLKFMDEDDFYYMVTEISFKGKLFQSFSEEQKDFLYAEGVNYSDEYDVILYCKNEIEKKDPEGKYLKNLSSIRIIKLLEKKLLELDELNNPNVDMARLIDEALQNASKTKLEILKKYANKAPNILDYMNQSYYHRDDNVYLSVKGEDFTDDETKELYTVKENYFFNYAPFLYEKFILKVIKETKDLIHSKEEWLSLLNYLEEDGSNLLFIKKELLSEAEYDEIVKKREETEKEEKRNSLMEKISNATCAVDIGWFYISKDMPDVKYAAYLKICELKDFSHKAEIIVENLYEDDLISDDEFVKFFKGKKQQKKQSKDKEAM